MKCLIVLSLLLIVVHAQLSDDFKTKVLDKLPNFAKECLKEITVTEDDINAMINKKPPTSKEAKCLVACFYEHLGIQDKDGKFSADALKKSLEPIKNDAELYGKMLQVIDKCIPEVENIADKCEKASKMNDCTMRVAKELGVDETKLM